MPQRFSMNKNLRTVLLFVLALVLVGGLLALVNVETPSEMDVATLAARVQEGKVESVVVESPTRLAVKLKDDGTSYVTKESSESFSELLKNYGVEPAQAMSPARQLYDQAECRRLAESAGLQDVQVESEQLGYHLRNPRDWWEIVWYTGLRNFVQGLAPDALASFRAAHLAEVESMAGADGLWIDAAVHFVRGIGPGRKISGI